MTTPTKDWAARCRTYQAACAKADRARLARELGVHPRSLRDLGLGYCAADDAFTFPERDSGGAVVGILRRFRDGTKKLLAGGRRGLAYPDDWHAYTGPVFVPEGATDTAALLSRGLAAVGRPNCTGGVRDLAALFADCDRPIVILGDNDARDGRWPGKAGAEATARHLADLLGRRVGWAMPPEGYKDVREYVQKGGGRG
jgi:hypothetical protein